MQDKVSEFHTRRGRKDALKLGGDQVEFEDRVRAMKRTHPKSRNHSEKSQAEASFPDNVIRQQITDLRVLYLSEPKLKELPRDIRRAEIRQNLYRYWDEATANLSDVPDLKEWVRGRIDHELNS